MADDVQSVETTDQGAEATDSGLYDLDSVAPEIREHLEPHLKAVQSNVEKKFREAAEYRKGWAPYEELGLRDIDPQSLQGLLGFYQMAQDPEQFAEWWKAAGEEQGLFEQQGPTEGDLGLESIEDELSTEKVQELIAEQLAQQLSPIQETLQRQEQERLQAEANEDINRTLAEIHEKHPDLPENADDVILRLSLSYADEADNPIEKGFADYTALIGQGEKSLFEQKSGQPQTPESGTGSPATGTEPITSFDDPRLKAQALERLRQSQR